MSQFKERFFYPKNHALTHSKPCVCVPSACPAWNALAFLGRRFHRHLCLPCTSAYETFKTALSPFGLAMQVWINSMFVFLDTHQKPDTTSSALRGRRISLFRSSSFSPSVSRSFSSLNTSNQGGGPIFTFGQVKGNALDGRSRHPPTNQSFRVCKVNLATLKVAITRSQR